MLIILDIQRSKIFQKTESLSEFTERIRGVANDQDSLERDWKESLNQDKSNAGANGYLLNPKRLIYNESFLGHQPISVKQSNNFMLNENRLKNLKKEKSPKMNNLFIVKPFLK